MPKLSAFRKALRSQQKSDKHYNMAFKPMKDPVFTSVCGYFYESIFDRITKKLRKSGKGNFVQPVR